MRASASSSSAMVCTTRPSVSVTNKPSTPLIATLATRIVPGRVMRGEAEQRLDDACRAAQRMAQGRHLATAIGVEHHVVGQHAGQRRDITLCDGRDESAAQTLTLLGDALETRARGAYMFTGTCRKLATGGRLAFERSADGFEIDVEHIV